MASTYSPNLKIELIGSGEQAGTWGTTTNKNWEKEEEASSSFAQVTITQPTAATASDSGWHNSSSTYNWTLSDTVDAYTANSASAVGSSGRAAFVEFIGTLGAGATVNIRGSTSTDYPNRVTFIKNSTVGGFDLTFDCDSSSDLVLKSGAVAAVYTDPGTAVGNVFSNLQVGGLVLEKDGDVVFEGETDNGFETTLTVVDPTADREIELPNASDTLVGKATTDTLTNKTLTSPVINTGISGDAFLDTTNLTENSASKVASQRSIKAYVDANVASNATTITVTADSTGSVFYVPFFASSATGSKALLVDGGIGCNPGENAFAANGGFSTIAGVDNVLNTNFGASAGATVTIENGTNADIILAPSGTGATTIGGKFSLNGSTSSSVSVADSTVLIGEDAGSSINNVLAAGSTCIGFEAGKAITSGIGNTFIGSSAGDTCTTGNKNICLGTDTTVVGSTNSDNTITIGTNISSGPDGSIKIGRSGTSFIQNSFISNNVWTHTSDERIKKNISDHSVGLDFVNALRPVTFEFRQKDDLDGSEPDVIRKAIAPTDKEGNELAGRPAGIHIGFIAQEVKSAIDSHGIESSSSGWSPGDDGIQTLGETAFIPSMVKAIQELSSTVDTLNARIVELEGDA